MRLLSVLLLLSFVFFTYAKVVQVQIVHRHGARQVLDKHETDPRLEQTSPTLYPQGVQQLQKLGSYCRNQYIETNSPSAIDGINPGSDLARAIISRTSNFQRTQLSARAFLSKLFPTHHDQIPTLVLNGTETDWIIRGYALCPTLAKRFQNFVTTDSDYKKQKDENEAFVVSLAKKLGYKEEDATFENIFNVYDEYNIVQNGYDDQNQKYENVDKLSDSEMTELKELADWYESHKFSYATHNVHVAGGLLAMIIDQARRVTQKPSESYRIVHISAHYPTLLTLLASIRSRNEGDLEWPASQIPEFGAALIFEVHEEDGEAWLRMKWFRGGDRDEDVTDVAIGRGDCTDAKKGCKLASVERLFAFDTFREEKFCSDCQSESGVCEFLRQSDSGAGPSSSQVEVEGSEVCSIGMKATSGAIGGALVLIVGLALWLLYSVCVMKRKRIGMEPATVNGFDSGFAGQVYA